MSGVVRQLVRFRLKDSATIEDRVLQSVVFRELVHRGAPWVTCASYEVDSHDRVLVIEVEDGDWIDRLPALSYYLARLDGRCVRPAARLAAGPAAGPDPGRLVGNWDPRHEAWCIPYSGGPQVLDEDAAAPDDVRSTDGRLA